MDNNEVPKSVRLPQWIWDAIARDAAEHYRSSNAQMMAILATYYGRPVPENIAQRIDGAIRHGSNVEPTPDMRIAYVENMGETTDERKAKRTTKPIKRKAGT